MDREIIDILIIGAGPSGMVAAGYLEKHDAKIVVLEKQKFPRFSIGESLIPRCMDNFEEAGLLKVLERQGFQKKYGARFIRGEEVANFDFSKKFGEGWNWTWQVPRADFDKALTDEMTSRGVNIHFGTEVISVEYDKKYWKIESLDENGKRNLHFSRFIIDSSGNGRVLAEKLNLEAPPRIHNHSSIFTHIEEKNRPEGIEGRQITFEILNTNTWFWYIPFSNGVSSLGFVGPTEWLDGFKDDNDVSFKAMLKELDFYKKRFDDHPFLFTPIKIRNISKNVNCIHGDSFALTGNSAEFLDPVFSSGVAFATESGLLAAKLALKEIEGEKVDWKKDYEQYIKGGVEVFSTYVREWYSGKLQEIFFHPDPNPQIKEQICAVLAGYVWDKKNPFVRKHDRLVSNLYELIKSEKLV